MNRSIGVLTQLPFLTCGKAGRAGVMNAQCLIPDCGLRIADSLIADCGLWIADSLTADRGLPYCEPPFNPQSAIRNPQSRAAEDDGAGRHKPVINVTKTITTARASLLLFITQPRSCVSDLIARKKLRVFWYDQI